MRTRKPEIGDLVEVSLPTGMLAYIQLAFDHPLFFEVVRVLPGRYQTRPADLKELVRLPEEYLMVAAATDIVHEGRGVIVDRADVPIGTWESRLLREAVFTRSGEFTGWRLVDDRLQNRVDRPLTTEEMRLPTTDMGPARFAVHMLAASQGGVLDPTQLANWQREHGLLEATTEPAEAPNPGEVAHTAFFTRKGPAVRARLALQELGFVCSLSQDEKQWILVAIGSHERHGSADAQWRLVEPVIQKADGQYDGWETNVSASWDWSTELKAEDATSSVRNSSSMHMFATGPPERRTATSLDRSRS